MNDCKNNGKFKRCENPEMKISRLFVMQAGELLKRLLTHEFETHQPSESELSSSCSLPSLLDDSVEIKPARPSKKNFQSVGTQGNTLAWHFSWHLLIPLITNICFSGFRWIACNPRITEQFKYTQMLRAVLGQTEQINERNWEGHPKKHQAKHINGSFSVAKQRNISSMATFWRRKRGPRVLAGCQRSDPHENTLLPKSHFWQSQPAFILPLNLSQSVLLFRFEKLPTPTPLPRSLSLSFFSFLLCLTLPPSLWAALSFSFLCFRNSKCWRGQCRPKPSGKYSY